MASILAMELLHREYTAEGPDHSIAKTDHAVDRSSDLTTSEEGERIGSQIWQELLSRFDMVEADIFKQQS